MMQGIEVKEKKEQDQQKKEAITNRRLKEHKGEWLWKQEVILYIVKLIFFELNKYFNLLKHQQEEGFSCFHSCSYMN